MRGAPLQTGEAADLGRDADKASDDAFVQGWNAAIEAAAKAVERYGLDRVNGTKDYPAAVASGCMFHIRELRR